MTARSPFPGMDPWLERHWGDLHHSIVQYARDQIEDELPPALFARVEETVYLAASEELIGRVRPDASVFESGRRDYAGQSNEAALAVAEPIRIKIDEAPVVLGSVEIRRLDGDQALVTAVEVISPTNKLDARNRRKYIRKREAFYAGEVNVVEIDLLRAGEALVDVPWDRVKTDALTPYRASIRRVPRADTDVEVEYYPIRLAQRLPRIGIPLRTADDDIVLDLQALVDRAYAKGRYGLQIDYTLAPPAPPLSASDAEWVAQRLREAGKLNGSTE